MASTDPFRGKSFKSVLILAHVFSVIESPWVLRRLVDLS